MTAASIATIGLGSVLAVMTVLLLAFGEPATALLTGIGALVFSGLADAETA